MQGLDEVVRWRCEQLVASGFAHALAANIAQNAHYDLHALIELVERGCEPSSLSGSSRRSRQTRHERIERGYGAGRGARRPLPTPHRRHHPSMPSHVSGCRAPREGATREEAIARLHALLLRAARFEVARRRHAAPPARRRARRHRTRGRRRRADEHPRRLDDFRGASRFTTWAYKFALLEAAVKLRKRAWQGREVPLEPEGWTSSRAPASSPTPRPSKASCSPRCRRAIAEALTPHQRACSSRSR